MACTCNKNINRRKKNHYKELENEKEAKELWFNFGMAFLSGYINTKLSSNGNTGQYFMPTYMEFDIDENSIPEPTMMKTYNGRDIRRFPVMPGSGILASIVRVRDSNGSCTGGVVSPRVVVTNWHCTGKDMSVRFEKLYTSEVIPVKKYLTFKGWNYRYDDEENRKTNWRNDWALLVLDKDIDVAPLKILPNFNKKMIKTYEGRLMVAGYSSDLESGAFLTIDFGCSPTNYFSAQSNETSGVLEKDCRAWKGASGSPVLVAGTNRLIALHAYGKRQYDNDNNKVMKCVDTEKCSGGGPDMSIVYKRLREIRKLIIKGEI